MSVCSFCLRAMAYMETVRSLRIAILVMTVILVVEPALGSFMVEKNSLTVITPKSLKGTYQSAIGNFGVPQYGGTLSGVIVYSTVNLKGCDKFPDDYFRSKPGAWPNFALIDRGGNVPYSLFLFLRIYFPR